MDDAFNREGLGRRKQIKHWDVGLSRTFCNVFCQQGKLQEEKQHIPWQGITCYLSQQADRCGRGMGRREIFLALPYK